KIVDQLQLPFTASLGRRVFTLVLDMPTLQKLGQVIARNPNLDPVFKQALVDLEDNLKTVTFDQIKPLLDKEIGKPRHGFSITPEPGILAEASVCAVVPAEVTAPTGHSFRAVLKVVKPKVTRNIGSELILLDRLAVFLDRHREEWGLGRFLFQATFTEVKKAIRSEMNLTGEQDNLDQAGTYYGGDQSLLVPARLPASTPRMTAMTRIDGTKITDVAGLTSRERWLLAAALARICILRPIQDTRDESIFHGDPHAGNLAYTFDGGRPGIILYDWAMIGKLNRVDRLAMVMLTLGLIMGNKKAVFYAADIIAKGQLSADPGIGGKIQKSINEVISSRGMKVSGAMSAIERLFEDFTYHGVIFSSDMMMYKKVLFTLQGVLTEIDPSFNRDDYLVWAAMLTFVEDLIKLRLLRLVLHEIWSLYRHSLALLFDVQKVVLRFIWDLGFSWAKLPRHFFK
ncbi:MAG: AarF/ABC1/UbiB kinase family protein, partial [Deltaproteobacteria bacterium]|nr:AarF/ABC1/UbiB kinase family protein [Deltaproteobacteria bacterium]